MTYQLLSLLLFKPNETLTIQAVIIEFSNICSYGQSHCPMQDISETEGMKSEKI